MDEAIEEQLRQLQQQCLEHYQKGAYQKAVEPAKVLAVLVKRFRGEADPVYAEKLNFLGMLYYQLGAYPEARRLQEGALRLQEQHLGKAHAATAVSHNYLGMIGEATGSYNEAEAHYRRALEIREHSPGPKYADLATSLNNIASFYEAQGRYEAAEAYYHRCLGIREKTLGPEHPDLATSLNNLAVLYYQLGRHVEAEPLLRRAIHIKQQVLGENHPELALSLYNLASIYQVQARYAATEELYQRALNILEKALGPEHPQVADGLNNLAAAYDHLERYAEAIPLYERALTIRRKQLGEQHPDVAVSANNLALAYQLKGAVAQAQQLYEEAINIWEKSWGPDHPHLAKALNNLGVLCQSRKQYEAALPLLERALAIREKHFQSHHPDITNSLLSLQDLLFEMEQYEAAEPYFLRANQSLIKQFEQQFIALSEKERSNYYQRLQSHLETFNSLVLARRARHPEIIGELYNLRLATKSIVLNSITKMRTQILQSGDEALIGNFQQWIDRKEQLAAVYRLSKTAIKEQGIEVIKLEEAANELEQQLSRQSEVFNRVNDQQSCTWRTIQKKLQVGEAAVEMIRFRKYDKKWTDQVHYAALVLRPEDRHHPAMVLLANGNELEGQYLEACLMSRQGPDPVAYQQYWRPIRDCLEGIRKVYFSPDGVYHQINLNIFSHPEHKGYVLDELDLHWVTNTKALLSADHGTKLTNKAAALFGRPAFNLPQQERLDDAPQEQREPAHLADHQSADRKSKYYFSDLPATETEVNQIAQLLQNRHWKVTSYLGRSARVETLKGLQSIGILHLATHGFFLQATDEPLFETSRQMALAEVPVDDAAKKTTATDPMLRAGIALAGASTADGSGILTAYDAANLALQDTALVVLSACETGLGDIQIGEGVYGLQRAFQIAGAKYILMSMWKVDDVATQELMTSFYEKWLESGAIRQAFREAQMELRERYPAPKYWGAFMLVGGFY